MKTLNSVKQFYNKFKVEQDKDLFWRCKTFEELKWLMYQVVLGKVGSPMYGMERNSPENTDNDWWVNGDPRYELLKELNKYGLMTLYAEEGSLTPYVSINKNLRDMNVIKFVYHCDLCFMYPKTKIHRLLDYVYNSDGYDIVLFDLNGPDAYKSNQFPIVIAYFSDGRRETWSSTRFVHTNLEDGTPIKYGGTDAYSLGFEEFCNPSFFSKIANSYYEVQVYDTVENRPAHIGLFKFLVNGVKKGII